MPPNLSAQCTHYINNLICNMHMNIQRTKKTKIKHIAGLVDIDKKKCVNKEDWHCLRLGRCTRYDDYALITYDGAHQKRHHFFFLLSNGKVKERNLIQSLGIPYILWRSFHFVCILVQMWHMVTYFLITSNRNILLTQPKIFIESRKKKQKNKMVCDGAQIHLSMRFITFETQFSIVWCVPYGLQPITNSHSNST